MLKWLGHWHKLLWHTVDIFIDCVFYHWFSFIENNWEEWSRYVVKLRLFIFIFQCHKEFLLHIKVYHLNKVLKILHNYNKTIQHDEKQNHMEVTIIINNY